MKKMISEAELLTEFELYKPYWRDLARGRPPDYVYLRVDNRLSGWPVQYRHVLCTQYRTWISILNRKHDLPPVFDVAAEGWLLYESVEGIFETIVEGVSSDWQHSHYRLDGVGIYKTDGAFVQVDWGLKLPNIVGDDFGLLTSSRLVWIDESGTTGPDSPHIWADMTEDEGGAGRNYLCGSHIKKGRGEPTPARWRVDLGCTLVHPEALNGYEEALSVAEWVGAMGLFASSGADAATEQPDPASFEHAPNQYKAQLEDKPWEKIPDRRDDREMVRLLWGEYSSPEIARELGNTTSKTVDNRLSVLRGQYRDLVPTREALKEMQHRR